MTELDSKKKEVPESNPDAVAKMAIWVVVVIVIMIIFATITWPSGNKISLTDFVIFWFRELLILGALLILLIVHIFSGSKTVGKKENQ